jgi:hypothetical protein
LPSPTETGAAVGKTEKLAKLSAAERQALEEIEARAIASFQGSFPDLESALGMLRMGHHFGWRVLYLVHSKATVRKYEGILGIRVRDLFPGEGPSSYRSAGFQIAQTMGNFWKIVSGAVRVQGRSAIER